MTIKGEETRLYFSIFLNYILYISLYLAETFVSWRKLRNTKCFLEETLVSRRKLFSVLIRQ